MNNDVSYKRFAALVGKHNLFSICLPQNPTIDSITSACVLYLALTKIGKTVSLACSSDIPKYSVTAVDKIKKTLASGGDSLVISFPYTEGSIYKVTYNIEAENFNLVVIPREGYDKLDPAQVKYNYSGGKIEAIIVIDSPNLNNLGELYSSNQDQFRGKEIINIDRHLTNGNFGTVNIVEKKLSSTAEIVLRVLSYLDAQLDREMATNLYNGIAAATNNFTSYSVNSDTFEASAYLLKSGAVKKPLSKPVSSFPTQPKNVLPAQQESVLQDTSFNEGDDNLELNTGTTPVMKFPSVEKFPSRPTSQKLPSEKQTAQFKQVENKEIKNEEDQSKPAPKEWLKPKIFRGSNLI